MPYGRNQLSTSRIFPTRVTADNEPMYKHGGITLDLTTLPVAISADLTLPDGSVLKSGTQYLRYGQVMCRIGVAEVATVTFTGGATAGATILTVPANGDYPAQSTNAIAFNASAAVMQAELQALTRIGPGGVVVGRTGAGTNGDPYIYTLTYARNVGDIPALTATHTFTGGTTPTTTIATTTGGGTTSGKFGPYDPDATDGRAVLAQGDCYVLDEIYVVNPAGTPMAAENDIIGGVFDGGAVYPERILHTGLGTHTLAGGPTKAELLAAFPRLGPFVQN